MAGISISGMPGDSAIRLNAQVNGETERGGEWTCFDVSFQVTRSSTGRTEPAGVDGEFRALTPSGSRPVNRRLLGGD